MRIFRKLLATGGVVLVGVALCAAPASASLPTPVAAHHALLEGTTTCPASDPPMHQVDWLITNSQPKEAMTITSAVVTLDGAPETITGYDATLAPGGHTTAQTRIDGTKTGTVRLTVTGRWTDGHTSSRHVDIVLTDPCPSVPSTTTPTTLPPVTATTSPRGATTFPPVVPPHSPSSPSQPSLPNTGSRAPVETVAGLGLLGVGALLVANRKKPARRGSR